jgi:hypothetical protein
VRGKVCVMKKVLLFFVVVALSMAAQANPMRFGTTTSPASFKVDLPGSWALSKIPGCWEDLMGSRLQAVIAENAEKTIENTYPDWKKRFVKSGYEVYEVNLQGAPAVIAKTKDSCMGIILRKGFQVNLMLNVSNAEISMDELLDRMAKTFQWVNP